MNHHINKLSTNDYVCGKSIGQLSYQLLGRHFEMSYSVVIRCPTARISSEGRQITGI